VVSSLDSTYRVGRQRSFHGGSGSRGSFCDESCAFKTCSMSTSWEGERLLETATRFALCRSVNRLPLGELAKVPLLATN
jgi:hypothetical protein